MFENLAGIDVKLEMLEQQLSDASLISDQKKYQQVVREHSHVSKLNTLYQQYKGVEKDIAGNKELLFDEGADAELHELAELEIEELKTRKKELEAAIRLLLLPKDSTLLTIRQRSLS